jgi:hypothetical protein
MRQATKWGLLFILMIFLGLSIGFGYQNWWLNHKLAQTFVPNPETFKLNPPSQAGIGRITTIAGFPQKYARDVDQPVEIVGDNTLVQGERLNTDATSSAQLLFPEVGEVKVGRNADITLVDTIPTEFLISHQGGVNEYLATGSNPMSIRSLHTVIELASSSATLTTLSSTKFRLEVHGGLVKIGYQDLDHKSYVKTVLANKTATFDDVKRNLTVK